MNGESSRHDKLVSLLEGGSSEPHNVPLKYLRNITNNFSNEQLLGEGGFGTVYKGVLQNGETIAVKKLNSSIPGVKDKQFENEASHLMRLKHPNVVVFVGWCSDTENIYVEYNGKYMWAEKSERLLCLEYMPKGNLRGYLSDEFSGLGWDTRYKIIEGICYGLRYLHEEWKLNAPIVHMDLKPANILLDNNMVPKIADFGLSRLFSETKTWTCTISRDGTLGYMSPEYINRGRVSTKSDIFSLGVIIIEIVTGRRDYPDDTGTPSEEFSETVLNNWSQRKGINILFGVSLETINYQQIRRCIQIGLDCVKTDWSKRPTISQIIKALHEPESADSSNIKGVHRPQSGKTERNCRETSWMGRLAKKWWPLQSQHRKLDKDSSRLLSNKKHTPESSIYETFTVALHQWQKKTALQRIRVIFTTVVFVARLKKRENRSVVAACDISRGKAWNAWRPGVEAGLVHYRVDNSVEFSYEELFSATEGFSMRNKIGQGGFGAVYYAELRGEKVAIKKMDMQASHEFLAELKVLTHVHHLNLVRLIGFCTEGSLFVVYEFIENGNLSQHLRGIGYEPLSWAARVQIALDLARGLEYIHEHTVPMYIHRDIKSANILIDKTYRAKVADFGLTKLTQVDNASLPTHAIVGTFGYMPPEYARYGDVSSKVDVYAFGVVLYELISAKDAIVRSTEPSGYSKGLVYLFEEALNTLDPKEGLQRLIDPALGEEYPMDSILKMAVLARACTQEDPMARPRMRSTVVALMTLSSTSEFFDMNVTQEW